jgi:hypothetical protein
MPSVNRVAQLLSLIALFALLTGCGINNIPTYDEAGK